MTPFRPARVAVASSGAQHKSGSGKGTTKREPDRFNLKFPMNLRARFTHPYDAFVENLIAEFATLPELPPILDEVFHDRIMSVVSKGPGTRWTIWVSRETRDAFDERKAQLAPHLTLGQFVESLLILRDLANGIPVNRVFGLSGYDETDADGQPLPAAQLPVVHKPASSAAASGSVTATRLSKKQHKALSRDSTLLSLATLALLPPLPTSGDAGQNHSHSHSHSHHSMKLRLLVRHPGATDDRPAEPSDGYRGHRNSDPDHESAICTPRSSSPVQWSPRSSTQSTSSDMHISSSMLPGDPLKPGTASTSALPSASSSSLSPAWREPAEPAKHAKHAKHGSSKRKSKASMLVNARFSSTSTLIGSGSMTSLDAAILAMSTPAVDAEAVPAVAARLSELHISSQAGDTRDRDDSLQTAEPAAGSATTDSLTNALQPPAPASVPAPASSPEREHEPSRPQLRRRRSVPAMIGKQMPASSKPQRGQSKAFLSRMKSEPNSLAGGVGKQQSHRDRRSSHYQLPHPRHGSDLSHLVDVGGLMLPRPLEQQPAQDVVQQQQQQQQAFEFHHDQQLEQQPFDLNMGFPLLSHPLLSPVTALHLPLDLPPMEFPLDMQSMQLHMMPSKSASFMGLSPVSTDAPPPVFGGWHSEGDLYNVSAGLLPMPQTWTPFEMDAATATAFDALSFPSHGHLAGLQHPHAMQPSESFMSTPTDASPAAPFAPAAFSWQDSLSSFLISPDMPFCMPYQQMPATAPMYASGDVSSLLQPSSLSSPVLPLMSTSSSSALPSPTDPDPDPFFSALLLQPPTSIDELLAHMTIANVLAPYDTDVNTNANANTDPLHASAMQDTTPSVFDASIEPAGPCDTSSPITLDNPDQATQLLQQPMDSLA